MIPRQDMKCLYQNYTFTEAMDFIKKHNHTRFPLCNKDKDHIIGMLHIRDLLEYEGDENDKDILTKLARKILFVPENKTMLVNAVLENLPNKKLVSASGMAGFRSSNLVNTRRVSKNFYFCGDGETAPVPGAGLMAPRVGVVACHEANMITRLILGEEDA